MESRGLLPTLAWLLTAILLLLHVPLVSAYNRLNALEAVGSIAPSWHNATIEAWVNDLRGQSEGSIQIGHGVSLSASSSEDGYFLFLLIDAKGVVSLFQPVTNSAGSQVSIGSLTQQEPLGKHFLYALVSQSPFPDAVVIDPTTETSTLPRNEDSIWQWVNALNRHATTHPVAVSKVFSYFVGGNTAIGSRGMKIGLDNIISSEPTPLQSGEQLTVTTLEQQTDSPQSATNSTDSIVSLRLDIKFALDDSRITTKGKQQLDVLGDAIIERLATNDIPTLLVDGHTDSTGTASYNLTLSRRRADSVKRYLISEFDIPSDLMITRGLGEMLPVDTNDTIAGRKNNRRVELQRAAL